MTWSARNGRAYGQGSAALGGAPSNGMGASSPGARWLRLGVCVATLAGERRLIRADQRRHQGVRPVIRFLGHGASDGERRLFRSGGQRRRHQQREEQSDRADLLAVDADATMVHCWPAPRGAYSLGGPFYPAFGSWVEPFFIPSIL